MPNDTDIHSMKSVNTPSTHPTLSIATSTPQQELQPVTVNTATGATTLTSAVTMQTRPIVTFTAGTGKMACVCPAGARGIGVTAAAHLPTLAQLEACTSVLLHIHATVQVCGEVVHTTLYFMKSYMDQTL